MHSEFADKRSTGDFVVETEVDCVLGLGVVVVVTGWAVVDGAFEEVWTFPVVVGLLEVEAELCVARVNFKLKFYF